MLQKPPVERCCESAAVRETPASLILADPAHGRWTMKTHETRPSKMDAVGGRYACEPPVRGGRVLTSHDFERVRWVKLA